MGGGVLGVGKPKGPSHRGPLLVGLVEGSVEVGQQLVPHLDGPPAGICHRLPQVQLLHFTQPLMCKSRKAVCEYGFSSLLGAEGHETWGNCCCMMCDSSSALWCGQVPACHAKKHAQVTINSTHICIIVSYRANRKVSGHFDISEQVLTVRPLQLHKAQHSLWDNRGKQPLKQPLMVTGNAPLQCTV